MPNPTTSNEVTTQTQRSKAIALKFCEHVHNRRFDLCATMFTNDANWLVIANPDRAVWGGEVWGGSTSAEQRCVWAGELLAEFEEWSYTVVGITAENDRVVVEGVSRGRGPGQVAYDNTYLMQFLITEGKIRDFKEAMDCFQVEKWFESREKRVRDAKL